MFSPRKARKSSPEPQRNDGFGNPGTPLQGRRRTNTSAANAARKAASSLVTPPSSKKTKTLPLYTTTPGSSTCNNFLLGGNYYPGKDKKVKHYRKRTLWHRIFCSSNWRVALSTIVVAYIVTWHVVVPGLSVALDYGNYFSGHRTASEALAEDIHLLSVESLQAQVDNMKELKEDIKGNSRIKILERIVPAWYHRGDKDPTKYLHTNSTVQDMTDEADPHTLQHHKAESRKHRPPRQEEEDEDSADAHHKEEEEKRRNSRHANHDSHHRSGDADANGQAEVVAGEVNGTTEPPAESDSEPKAAENKVNETKSSVKATIAPKESAKLNATEFAVKAKAAPTETMEEPQPQLSANKSIAASTWGTERTLHNMDELPNQSQCPGSITSLNTTLVVQCSVDRLWILTETCKRWHDPIVAVVYLQQKDSNHSFHAFKSDCPQATVISHVADSAEKDWHYPVNRLRNLGLDAVQTSHVLVADVDFVPALDLDEIIRAALTNQSREVRQGIVVPAFEKDCPADNDDCSQLSTDGSYIPRDLDELRSCVRSNNCSVFQANNNWEGHSSTRSDKWLRGEFYDELRLPDNSTSRSIKSVACFDSLRYEPYVVIPWCSYNTTKPLAPYYDERFYGYGKNKIQWVSHLRFLGYKFLILPNGFITHNPHPESNAKKVWNDVEDYKLHEAMDALYPQFLEELYQTYRDVTDLPSIVQQCQREPLNR